MEALRRHPRPDARRLARAPQGVHTVHVRAPHRFPSAIRRPSVDPFSLCLQVRQPQGEHRGGGAARVLTGGPLLRPQGNHRRCDAPVAYRHVLVQPAAARPPQGAWPPRVKARMHQRAVVDRVRCGTAALRIRCRGSRDELNEVAAGKAESSVRMVSCAVARWPRRTLR
eukprot:1256572-Prymnesium_polylepis.1